MQESTTRRDALSWLSLVLRTESHNLVRWPDVLWQQLDNRIRVGESAPARVKVTAAVEREARRREGLAWFALDAQPKGIDDISLITALSPRGPLPEGGWQRITLGILCCDARGDLVVAGANDGTVRMMRAKDLVEIAYVRAHLSQVMAVCWIAEGARFVSAGLDGAVCIWDAVTLLKLMTVETGQGRLYSCASATSRFATGGSDGTAIVWNGITGEKIAVFSVEEPTGYGSEITVALSRDGELLATGSKNRSLCVWSVADGRQLAIVDAGQNNIRACPFVREDTTIVSCGGRGKVTAWEWSSTRTPLTVATTEHPLFCLSYDPESDHVVFGGEDRVVWSHAVSGEGETCRVTEHAGEVYSCSVGEGAVVFSGSDEGVVKRSRLTRQDASHGRGIGHDMAVTCCAMTADRTIIATGEGFAMRARSDSFAPPAIRPGDMAMVKLWSKNGTLAGRLPGHRIRVSGCCFAPDGVSLVVSDDGGWLTVWSATSTTRIFETHASGLGICSPTLSADSRWLAVVEAKRMVLIYDLQASTLDLSRAGAVVAGLWGVRPQIYHVSCAFSPDGSTLACATLDRHVELWQEPWKTIVARSQTAEAALIKSLVWSPDGATLVCGTEKGSLVTYDANTLVSINRFRGHAASVTSCAFTASGDILFSASEDGSARAWKWPIGAQIALLPTQGTATCVAAGGEASGCVGDEAGAVYLFHLVRGTT